MTAETVPPRRRLDWVTLYNALGVFAIVIVGILVYRVVLEAQNDIVVKDALDITIENITPEEARSRLLTDDKVILLDVRSDYEWENSQHAQGAQSLPLSELETNIETILPDKDAPVMLMCYTGNVRSMKAAEWLINQGYTNVINVDGGLLAWQSAKLPLEAPPPETN